MSKYRWFRIMLGGHWEKSRTLGWYRHDRQGRIPPNIIDYEDNTGPCMAFWTGVASACLAAAIVVRS